MTGNDQLSHFENIYEQNCQLGPYTKRLIAWVVPQWRKRLMVGSERKFFTPGDKVYNKKLKIYGIFRVISGEQHIDLSKEEDRIGDRWYSEDMVLASSVCCCDLSVLMVEGCQCGGK